MTVIHMHKFAHGFTLIELAVAVAVLGILLAVGLPSMTDLISSNGVTSQTNDFITALNTARAEAIRRGAPVCVKRISASSNSWTEGWKVFVDGTTTRTIANDSDRCATEGTLIQSYAALTGGNTLTSDANFDAAIRFNALGVAVNHSDTGISGDFHLCRRDKSTTRSRRIHISITGIVGLSTNAPACS